LGSRQILRAQHDHSPALLNDTRRASSHVFDCARSAEIVVDYEVVDLLISKQMQRFVNGRIKAKFNKTLQKRRSGNSYKQISSESYSGFSDPTTDALNLVATGCRLDSSIQPLEGRGAGPVKKIAVASSAAGME